MVLLRRLARRPAFTLVSVATIALGIGATTTIFSVVKPVLLDPLPWARPDELVTLDSRAPTGFLVSLSIPNYRDWRDRHRAFSTFGAAAGWGLILTGAGTGGGPAEVLRGQAVLGEFFETLGLEPAVGRLIPAGETDRGADPVVVLGYAAWQQRFGGDTSLVGRALVLDGRPYTVVGVLPPGTGWPSPATEFYIPMGSDPTLPWDDRGSGFGTRAIARLAPGVTLDAARTDLARVGREVQEMVGEEVAQPNLVSFEEFFLGDVDAQLWVLLAAVWCVLLIAVANVANLVLARGEDRRRELAVRTALGAGRWILARELLAESLVLSAAGGVLGVTLAWAGVGLLLPLLPAGIPDGLVGRIGPDPGVLGAAAGVTVLAGLLLGVVPAVRAARVQPAEEMRGGRGQTAAAGRLRDGLVVAEVAIALTLLVGAGLMVRSFAALRAVDKGFEADGLLTARVGFPDAYRRQEPWLAFTADLRERVRAIPGVRDAAMTLLLPLSHRSWERRAIPEGRPLEDADDHSFLFGVVTPEYFRTLRVPVLAGRGFDAGDHADAVPVAVIDERMARTFWPGESPIGKRVYLGESAPGSGPGNPIPRYRTVVGVTRNVRHYEIAAPSRIQAYIPHTQAWGLWGLGLYVVAATDGPPERLADDLRAAVAGLDPGVALSGVEPLTAYVDRELRSSRAMGGLLTAFGAAALLLAGLGIYGVLSYTVARRAREIGIRMALGASRHAVLGSVVRRALAVSGVGTVVGLVAAALLSRLVESLLYEVSPVDPATYGAFAVFLLTVAAVAALVPARRAAGVDPMVALREE